MSITFGLEFIERLINSDEYVKAIKTVDDIESCLFSDDAMWMRTEVLPPEASEWPQLSDDPEKIPQMIARRFSKVKKLKNSPDYVIDTLASYLVYVWEAIQVDADSPIASSILLAYKCGRFPAAPKRIPGRIRDLLDISPTAAAKLLDQGEEILRVVDTRPKASELARQFANTIPDNENAKHIVRNAMLHYQEIAKGDFRVISDPRDFKAKDKIPAEWKQVVSEQAKGKTAPWLALWRESGDLFPAATQFLSTACRYVLVLEVPGWSPILLYAFLKSGVSPSIDFYEGRVPVVRFTRSQSELFSHLPKKFVDFYRTTHDGWYWYQQGGPLSAPLVQWLSELVDPGVKGYQKYPFRSEDQMIKVLSFNGGQQCLCYDVKNSTEESPKGVECGFKTGLHTKKDLDFWKAINREIARTAKDLTE